MARSRKKVSNPPKDVSPSTTKIEDNEFEEAPRLNGNFNIWEERMRNFLQTQGIEVWKSVIADSRMDEESKEYNAKAVKAILNGLPDSVKNNLGKCLSAKDIWLPITLSTPLLLQWLCPLLFLYAPLFGLYVLLFFGIYM